MVCRFSFYDKRQFYIYPKEDEMIYLRNTTDAQNMFIPKNRDIDESQLTFVVRNTIELDGFTSVLTDLMTSDLYHHLAISLPENLADGEYHYSLMEGNILLSSGLLYIGDLSHPQEYGKTINYTQYECK